jgi:cyanophycinase
MFVLVGSGEYLPAVDLIDQTLMNRLTEPARVVCLPTAAGQEGEASVRYWMEKGVAHFTRLGVAVTAVPVIDAASAQDPAHVTAIRQANFIYLSGGNPGYLFTTLNNSPAWEAILAVHQAGGIVAGCSAGAMIMGEQILGPGSNRPGFNLLPGTVIVPHFDEIPGILSRIMRFLKGKKLTMIGIDGGTALVMANGRYEVLGQNQVTVFSDTGTNRYRAGLLPKGLLDSTQAG